MRTSVRRLSRYGRLMAPVRSNSRSCRSYVDIDDLPYVNAEVAFVGRSNVGKSSLLNARSAEEPGQDLQDPGRPG